MTILNNEGILGQKDIETEMRMRVKERQTERIKKVNVNCIRGGEFIENYLHTVNVEAFRC